MKGLGVFQIVLGLIGGIHGIYNVNPFGMMIGLFLCFMGTFNILTSN